MEFYLHCIASSQDICSVCLCAYVHIYKYTHRAACCLSLHYCQLLSSYSPKEGISHFLLKSVSGTMPHSTTQLHSVVMNLYKHTHSVRTQLLCHRPTDTGPCSPASYHTKRCCIDCCVFLEFDRIMRWHPVKVQLPQSINICVVHVLTQLCTQLVCVTGEGFAYGSLITSCLRLKGFVISPALITSGPCCWNDSQPPQISLYHWTGKLASRHTVREQSWDAKKKKQQQAKARMEFSVWKKEQ